VFGNAIISIYLYQQLNAAIYSTVEITSRQFIYTGSFIVETVCWFLQHLPIIKINIYTLKPV